MALIDRLIAAHARIHSGVSLGGETPVSGWGDAPVDATVDFNPRPEKLPFGMNFDPAGVGQPVQLYVLKTQLPVAPQVGVFGAAPGYRYCVVHAADAGHVWLITCTIG